MPENPSSNEFWTATAFLTSWKMQPRSSPKSSLRSRACWWARPKLRQEKRAQRLSFWVRRHSPVGWGSSTRRGGGRKLRARPRNFVFLGFRREESGMSREFCRDVPDPWRCSKSLCKKTSCAFFVPYKRTIWRPRRSFSLRFPAAFSGGDGHSRCGLGPVPLWRPPCSLPWSSFPCSLPWSSFCFFWNSLCIFALVKISLLFRVFLPSFPQGLGGLLGKKNPCSFRSFSLFFTEKVGTGRSGFCRPPCGFGRIWGFRVCCFRSLTLRSRRPATGVSRALRARSVPGVSPRMGGVRVSVRRGVPGPGLQSVQVSREWPRSQKRCPEHSGETLGTLFGHSGARGPKGLGDTPSDTPSGAPSDTPHFRGHSRARRARETPVAGRRDGKS